MAEPHREPERPCPLVALLDRVREPFSRGDYPLSLTIELLDACRKGLREYEFLALPTNLHSSKAPLVHDLDNLDIAVSALVMAVEAHGLDASLPRRVRRAAAIFEARSDRWRTGFPTELESFIKTHPDAALARIRHDLTRRIPSECPDIITRDYLVDILLEHMLPVNVSVDLAQALVDLAIHDGLLRKDHRDSLELSGARGATRLHPEDAASRIHGVLAKRANGEWARVLRPWGSSITRAANRGGGGPAPAPDPNRADRNRKEFEQLVWKRQEAVADLGGDRAAQLIVDYVIDVSKSCIPEAPSTEAVMATSRRVAPAPRRRPSSTAAGASIFHPVGKDFLVRFGNDPEFTLRGTMGAKYLHILLQTPGRAIHVCELYAAISEGVVVKQALDVETNLDSVAVKALRARIVELDDEIDAVRDLGGARVDELEGEKQVLVEELEKETGFGGLPRPNGKSVNEKTRVKVKKAFDVALKNIKKESLGLHAHLSLPTLRLGWTPVYHPADKVEWQL